MKRLFIFTLISLLVLGTMACGAVDIQSNEEIIQNETSSNTPEEKDNVQESSNFDDVKPEDYFYHTVGLAKKAGIVKNNEKLFRPREPVTREEMMMFTAAALQYAVPGIGPANLEVLNGFSDADLVSPEARESAAILVENRIILGAGGKLMPRERMTRAEAATVLYRLFKLMWSE